MSRFFIFLIPVVVIAVFWVMSRYEAKGRHDPTRKSFLERNGTVLGIVFIGLVAFWTLFLVALPYLYMVQESFHPRLPPMKRGGPDDFLTIQHLPGGGIGNLQQRNFRSYSDRFIDLT